MARRVVDETRGKEGTDMDEHVIRELTSEVRRGRLSRRRFIQTMVGVGLTAPMAAKLLSVAGVAEAQPKTSSTAPAHRGGGGQGPMLSWAGPPPPNPPLALAPNGFESLHPFYA